MSKVCQNCQANNNDEARYCANCGNSLKQVEQSQEKTEEELIILANQGDIESQLNLGFGYLLQKDYTEALKWYKKAAEQGNIEAQNSMGFISYFKQEDYYEAFKWYRKLAEQGDSIGQHMLGVMYDNGKGVQQDYYEAYNWFQKTAKQGNSEAQCRLGFMYSNGEGVQQNYYEALKWYKKAAEQGDSIACNSIGIMYMKGLGVKRNHKKGIKWFEKALQYDKENNEAEQNLRLAKQSSGCFIATAVYNSPTAPKVIILKEFRDQQLLTTSLGKSVVQFYYKHSPPIANFLSKHKLLSEIIRIVFIEPLVWMVQILVVLKM